MSGPLLSFAIPVYNFGRFVGETVESIVTGAEILSPAAFEILVLDGGSTDDTAEVVAGLAARFPNVRYARAAQRGGIDHDLNLAVASVHGQYVWMFSGDDLLVPGWDRHVVPLLDAADVALVPTVLCNLDMSERRRNPIFDGCDDGSPAHFEVRHGDGSLAAYLARARSLDALFGFMSSVIVRADYWHALPERRDFFGTCWAHCARLIQGFEDGSRIAYTPHCLIRKRGGNDSFMENGLVARIAIAVDGWRRIARELLPDPAARQRVYALLRQDISLPLFLYGKVSARSPEERTRLHALAQRMYREGYVSPRSRAHYLLFRLSPLGAFARPVLARALPRMIRLRHWLKR